MATQLPRGYYLYTAANQSVLYLPHVDRQKAEEDPVMAQHGIRYLEQLLKQAGKETNLKRLDQLTAEIYRVVAEREQIRTKPRSRLRGIRQSRNNPPSSA